MSKLSRNPDKHWDPVAKACKYEGDLEPACIEAYYDHLDRHNELEWSIWLEEFFMAQWWIATVGGLIVFEAPFDALACLLGLKPDISQAPWKDVDFVRGLWYQHLTFNAYWMQTYAFFWTQLFTWGQSDFRDFQIPFAMIWVA